MQSLPDINIISRILKQVLDFIMSIVGNYGWSVVIFTLLIRLVVLPLDISSKKGMRKTQAIQPKMKALQDKYAKDKDKLNQKMQELYKKEKINPMSGCLPMLLQMPILFCMYPAMNIAANEHTVQMLLDLMNGKQVVFQSWMWIKNVFQPDSFMSTVIPHVGDKLDRIQAIASSSILTQENVEAVKHFVASDPKYIEIATQFGAAGMRYSAPLVPFLGWNINIPMVFNGLFILPLVAAVSQFLSSKLLSQSQPTPTDGSAASTNQMMQWMFPIMSIFFCATSSGAFSLYWVAIAVIQSLTQYIMNLYFDRKDKMGKPEEVMNP